MRRAFLALMLILSLASRAGAAPTMSVEVGWDGKYRAGHWTPIYVTMADSGPREVVMEVEAPYDRRYQIVIRQGLTIGPNPIIAPIYVPLNQSLTETRIALRSPSGRQLVSMPLQDEFNPMANQRGPQQVNPGVIFAGMSGAIGTQRMVETQIASDRMNVGYLPPERLPAVVAGYQALDLLILNQPDLRRIADDQQQAIMQWVRGGGNLVMWPGPEPVPVTSALVDALPARIGENRNYDVDPRQLKSAGLPDRFKQIKGRQLTPLPHATTMPVFSAFSDGGVSAYRSRVGFGQVLLLPVDVSQFRFDSSTKSEAFWRKLLSAMVDIPVPSTDGTQRYYYDNAMDNRKQAAMTHTLNWMGSVPGAGTFGFSYIAIVLILMMVIVGPIDWFVLKMMGRQPWTWVTTAGWAGLITLGAIFVGHAFKSGDLHFRTTSIVDEADNQRVAATDIAAIYSPRTDDYELVYDPESWWHPAAEYIGWSGGGGLKVDIPCHQDYHGNRPLPLRVNVWNLRFIEGETVATAPAVIESDLTLQYDSKLKKRVIGGTITNHAASALKNVLVRVSDGVATVEKEIAPQATVTINAPIDTKNATFATVQPQQPRYYGRWGGNDMGPSDQPALATIADLASDRSDRVEKLLKQYRETACVYAECQAAPESVKLDKPEAKRQHQQVIRSLVHLVRKDVIATTRLHVISPNRGGSATRPAQ